ncbi:hypothetical protein TBC1_12625 [Lentimicrobium saccharophilum]|uniref:Uncharacterized protein n=1 Tax=Lentimicrobium saccharophilum TaxID=1678841 RepID=A0A0S7C3Q4_9BACT|nr:hypothetical protein [Lentimicrobium saccharophilum]GAP44814.1 hypothetical protein TBC1_12625 [Lentimicrobium saccharophilum]
MKTQHLITVFTLFLLFGTVPVSAQQQDTLKIYLIETSDGNQFSGRIISENQEKLELLTEKFGKLVIAKEDIVKITELTPEKIVQGKLWLENTQSSRYFWSPNGYGLKKGEGYYQNIWILWNQASFGITDYFSLGFGLIPLFLFGADAIEYSPVWVVPKFSLPVIKDKFNIGAGLLAGNVGLQKDAGFGIAYGLGTLGNRNSNITLGLGYGFAAGNWAKSPMINIGFMARTGPKGYILSENYFIRIENESLLLFSFGGRTLTKTVGIDYGLFIPIIESMEALVGLPWLGLTIPFKQGKMK